mgnify:CR=1 FL=1
MKKLLTLCLIMAFASSNIVFAATNNQKGNKTMGIKGKNDRMVVLACEDCKERNYTTTKNKKNIKERLELSKYCPTCKKHTNHKETK